MTSPVMPKKSPLGKAKKPSKASSEMVIGGKKREVFHLPHCEYAWYLHGSNRIEFENAQEARDAGFIPCRICLGWTA
ncbi:MAG: hypothetical protein WDN01_06460 [Rhizomicrobium sp.]